MSTLTMTQDIIWHNVIWEKEKKMCVQWSRGAMNATWTVPNDSSNRRQANKSAHKLYHHPPCAPPTLLSSFFATYVSSGEGSDCRRLTRCSLASTATWRQSDTWQSHPLLKPNPRTSWDGKSEKVKNAFTAAKYLPRKCEQKILKTEEGKLL